MISSRPLAPLLAALAATLLVCAVAVFGLFLLRLRMGVTVPTDPLTQSTAKAEALYVPPAPPRARTAIFTGVHVIDVLTGMASAERDVLIQDGRITAIEPHLTPPDDALVIAAKGQYVMPGLIDTHVHVTADDQLFLFLASGVTTVQGLGGPRGRNLEARQRQRRGEIAAPDYVSCDTVIPGGASGTAEEKIRAALADGADCLKIYSPPDWTRDEHRALTREATRRGLRIGGHLPRNLPLSEGLGGGQQFVAHAEEFLYAHFNKQLRRRDLVNIGPAVQLARRSGASVIATLVAYKAIVDQVGSDIHRLLAKPELQHVEPSVRESWQPGHNRYRRRFSEADGMLLSGSFAYQQQFVKALDAAGVTLALGTDSSPQMPFVIPGFSAIDEARELHRAGLSNAAVLRAATLGGATLLRRADRIGRVAVGMDADLLLLDADPLADIEHLIRRAGVMAKGRWMTDQWLKEHRPVYPVPSTRQ